MMIHMARNRATDKKSDDIMTIRADYGTIRALREFELVDDESNQNIILRLIRTCKKNGFKVVRRVDRGETN